ncbi:SCO5717 family growth-regulating ATPase, partial [Streptomyces sp. UH6]|uniref:SCO5717 family growth-regulating ATPase n=1 Tax=Streptomyces sp. UH6 TaxID=2748379 RepID=UPI00179B37FB
MNSDRDGIHGGWTTPGDDQSDAESAVETTGEFTIDYDTPAWYRENAGGAADSAEESASWEPSEPVGPSAPADPPPPAAPSPSPAPPAPPAPPTPPAPSAPSFPSTAVPGAPGGDLPFGGGQLESGATMRISAAALRQEIEERAAAAVEAVSGEHAGERATGAGEGLPAPGDGV